MLKNILKIILICFLLVFSIGIISAENSTFADLQREITNSGSNSVLNLNTDYKFNESDPTSLKNGISISQNNFVLDGKGHTIDGGDQARIFQITGENVTIINIKLINGYTVQNGGGIQNTGKNNILSNVIIENNIAARGAGIYNTGNNFTISGSNNIINNYATANGGGIFNTGSDFTISGSNNIINNHANNSTGGGIYNTGSGFTISGSNNIINNSAVNNGGGIQNTGNNFVISGSNNIINNNVIANGGGIFNTGSDFTISGSNNINNNSATYGGGIYNHKGNNFFINGSNNINSNYASYSGGGIHNSEDSNNFVISGSNNIINNINTTFGGGIYNRGNDFIISGSNNIINNSATSCGGGIENYGSNFFINGSNNINNNSARWGGGIHNYKGSNFFINGSNNINNNYASESGGGIHNYQNNNFTISGSNNINNNNAEYGGGIHNNGGINFFINGSNNINNNTAINNFGTGIYTSGELHSLNTLLNGSKYVIYNDINSILFLNNNIIISDTFEEIFNNGTIISEVIVTYIDNETVYSFIGHSVPLNAILTDDMGNVIVGQNVSFEISNILDKNISSFIEGYYLTNNTFNQVGTFILSGNYVGGNNLTILKGTIIIEKIPTNKVVNIPQEIIVGGTVVIESILYDKDGKPMGNETIEFFIDGKSIGTAITDSNGVVKINHTFDTIGNYNISTKFNETLTHYDSNATNQTKVIKIEEDKYVPPNDDFEPEEDPVKPVNPKQTNNNKPESDLPSAIAMQTTGNPVVIVLLVLLSLFGAIGFRKRE